VFENLDDPDYLVGIAMTARNNVLGVVGSNVPRQDKPAACLECGRESPSSSSFCGHCGAAISTS
jgi:hypothetical protein